MRVLLFVIILTGTVIADDPAASNDPATSDDISLIEPKIHTDIASESLDNTESPLAVNETVSANNTSLEPATDLSGEEKTGREDNSANEQSGDGEPDLEDGDTVGTSKEDTEDGAGPSTEGNDINDDSSKQKSDSSKYVDGDSSNEDTDSSKDDDDSSNQDADSKNGDEDSSNQDNDSSNEDLVALNKDDDSSILNDDSSIKDDDNSSKQAEDQSNDEQILKPGIEGNDETSSNEVTTDPLIENDKEADTNKGKSVKNKPDDMDDSPKVLDDDSLTVEKVSHFQSVKLLFYIMVPTTLLVLVYFVMKALRGRGRMLARYQILHSRATDNIELRPLGYDSDEEDIVFDSRNRT